MMKFRAHNDRPPVRGRLLYVVDDHAFDFRPAGGHADHSGAVTLGLDTLQLDADVETGQIVGVWGYFPREGWKPATLASPHRKPGTLYVSFERQVESGSSYALDPGAKWDRLFDSSTGWLSVRQPGTRPSELIEYADGVVAGLVGDRLVELWLRPEFVDSLGAS